MNLRKTTLSIITLLIMSLYAGATEAPKSIFDLMNYQEVVNVTLELDLAKFQNDRRDEEYHVAGLWFEDAEGREQAWRLKVKLRGKFRRMNCVMPPLKLNFKKGELAVAGLSQFDDMKLVTHCTDDPQEAKRLLAKEYLAYKMYNKVSPYSYRVQMLRITYKDINTGEKLRRYGFLIEDLAQLRSRIQANKVDREDYRLEQLAGSQLQLASLFNYMIGNADWDIQGARNIKVVKRGTQLLAIPYDFDFAGMVEAPYAIPNPNYNLKHTKERVYLGMEKDTKEMKENIAYLLSKRNEMLDEVYSTRLLSSAEKRSIVAYLDEFFDNPNDIIFPADRKALQASISQ